VNKTVSRLSRVPRLSRVRLAALCLLAAPIQAEVLGPGVPLPGLESDPPGTVVPKSCAVSVTAGNVTVDLSLRSDHEMPKLLLNGYLFGWTGETDPYPDRHFPELEIRIDDVPATLNDRFEAFAGKNNVTNPIRAAQMDPWAITRTPPYTQAHPTNPQVLNVLRNAGAIEIVDDHYLAKWKARRVLLIPLNPVPNQQVELRYSARPARSSLTVEQIATPQRENEYCLSSKELRGALHAGPAPRMLSVTEYTIPTAIDENSPSTVTLTMSAGDPRARIFVCGPHRKSVAKTDLKRQPVLVDEHGILQVLSVVESPAESPAKSP
jgi:hypothetical protein